MAYSIKILRDSVNICGNRLTTWELTYPRMVHAELMTHRLFSRNSASSRAIPIEKMIAQVLDDPAGPVYWGKNQSGMQAKEELDYVDMVAAKNEWLWARDDAVLRAQRLLEIGAHKQIVNRLLEPWMWITVIVSATEYGNWFNLRCHPDAQPEIKFVADAMAHLYQTACPRYVKPCDWHLPLIGFPGDEEMPLSDKIKVSTGRCARVSYLTHLGERDVAADIKLHDRLSESGHWSPFEHVAAACDRPVRSGNFIGWSQYRKHFGAEHKNVYPWIGGNPR